jgi:hypothetical protein
MEASALLVCDMRGLGPLNRKGRHMKKIISLAFAIGLLIVPGQSLAAPKKGITIKNLVFRYESTLKFLGTSVPKESKKLSLEYTKREDGRKAFASSASTDWKMEGITFPSSDIIEDVIFWYTFSTWEYARYEHSAFLSSVSSKSAVSKRLDEAYKMIWDVSFNAPPNQDGVTNLEKNNYVFSIWSQNDITYYRLNHLQSELGDAWRKEKGFLQPSEAPKKVENPSGDTASIPFFPAVNRIIAAGITHHLAQME